MTRRLRTALRIVALAALTLLPFAASGMGASPWAELLAWLAATLAVAAYLAALGLGEPAPPFPLGGTAAAAVGALVVLPLVSAAANPAPAVGLRAAAPFCLVVLLLPAAAWAAARARAGAVTLLVGSVAGAGALAAAAALGQALGLLSLPDSDRATAMFGDPNQLSGLLDMTLPLVAAGALFGRRRRALFALLTALVVVAQGLTFSRAGWIVSVAVLLALSAAWAAGARGARRARRWTGLATIAVLLSLTATAMLALSPRVRGGLERRLAQVVAVQSDTSAKIRLALWRGAVPVVAHHPAVGVGYGAFGDAVVRYRGGPPQGGIEGRLTSSIGHAHDDLLTVLAELGPLGAIAFAILVGSAVLGALRSGHRRALRWGITLALCALAAHGAVDGFLSRASPLLPIWLVLAAAGSARAAPPRDGVGQPSARIVTPAARPARYHGGRSDPPGPGEEARA